MNRLFAIVLLALAACASQQDSRPQGDGAVQDNIGASFECMSPPQDAAPGPTVTCTVGKTYCSALRPRGGLGAFAQCEAFPDSCAATPTCACILPTPLVNCSCEESNGMVTLTCDRI